MLKLLELFK